jgi:protein-tyrosine phosphatase
MPGEFVDLHCHILPGLDDGAQDLAAALDLVRRLEALGFRDFHPTPHQKASSYQPSAEQAGHAAAALREALAAAGSSAVIHPPGGENMWDELFLARRPGSFPTYPGGRAFLLEFPAGSLPPAVPETLFQMHLSGRLPVLAHVERYPRSFGERKRAEAMGRASALLVNLGALGGGEGWAARRLARDLVKAGLVHAVATDVHQLSDLPAIAAGMRWLSSRLGEGTARRLLRDAPQRIIAGELPEW